MLMVLMLVDVDSDVDVVDGVASDVDVVDGADAS